MALESRPDSPTTSSQCLPCMASLIKEEVEFPACVTLWQVNLHKVAAPYFLLLLYMVQLYKEDWKILHMLGCWACSPEQ